MTKVPSLDYKKVLTAFRRTGFVEVRQKGSHIRIQKETPEGTIKLTIPAHYPRQRQSQFTLRRSLGIKRVSTSIIRKISQTNGI